MISFCMCLFFVCTCRLHKEQADDQRDNIEHNREIQHVLVSHRIDHVAVGILDKAARIAHNQGCDLVAGKTCKRPCGKGDTVDRADAAHTVMVGKQGRHIGEAAAVSGVHHKDQRQHENDQEHVALAVLDTACKHYRACKYNREHEDQLIDRISVLHQIRPRGEAETAARIEDCRHCGDHADHACQTDAFHNHLLLGNQRKTACDVDVEHQPDADIVADGTGFDGSHDTLPFVFLLGLMPACRLRQKKMAHKHHYKVNRCEDVKHLIDAALSEIGQKRLHDRACNRLRTAKARYRKTCGKTFLILEPEHESLYRGKIARSEADTHDKAIADINAYQRKHAAGMGASIIDEESRAGHTKGKSDRSDQGRLMYVLLHHIAQKCCGHAEEKDGEAERPLRSCLGKAYIVSDLLTENRPAVHRTDTEVQEQCRDRGTHPFVLTVFHTYTCYPFVYFEPDTPSLITGF